MKEQNIIINKKLKHIYDCLIKNIMNIFESKLLFNQPYPTEEINNKSKHINADVLENINSNTDDKTIKNNIIENNDKNNENKNDMNKENKFEKINNIIDNDNNICFKEIVNKGIYDYISIIRFCNSSKNLTSADNISEEIDLDDMNNSDENDNLGNNKNFTLTSFDELDDEENSSYNDSIGEIFKKTTETIKTIKLRSKMNDKEIIKKNENIINEENKIAIKN